ncbi:hypothetical protein BTH42_29665 [Burkholderia sp. SRS-W-2-2016]|nr:hypothetical protein BTH42_29665 [Burkholderia sp. SRS-W-2-2016]
MAGGEGGGETAPGNPGLPGDKGPGHDYSCCMGSGCTKSFCYDLLVRKNEDGTQEFASLASTTVQAIAEPNDWMPYASVYPQQALTLRLLNSHANLEPFLRDCVKGRSPEGPLGEPGDPGSGAAAQPKGKAGVLSQFTRPPEEFSIEAEATYLSYVLTYAEDLFLSGEAAEAARMLNWISRLTKRTAHIAALVPSTASETVKSATLTRAQVLLRRMACGLDYFGNARNHVPVAAPKVYSDAINTILPIGQSVEAAYFALFDANTAVLERRTLVVSAVTSAKSYVDNELEQEKLRLADEAKVASDAINLLLLEIEETRSTVVNAAEKFKSAVEQGRDCKFEEIVSVVGQIVAVANGAWPAVLSLAEQLSQVGEDLEERDFEFNDVVEHVEVIGKDYQKIDDAYKKIKDLIADPSRPDLAKIAQSKEEFDKMIEPYARLVEAEDYKKAMYHYFDITQARNNKALELAAIKLRVMESMSKAEHLRFQRNALEVSFAQGIDPSLTLMLSFMQRAYYDIRRALARIVYEENRSIEFWSLSQFDTDMHGLTVDQIRYQHGKSSEHALSAVNAIESAHSSGRFIEWQMLSISELVSESAFNEFKSTGTLFFSIRPDNFRAISAFPNMRLTSARVLLNGVITGDDGLNWTLVHTGLSTFYPRVGTGKIYSHNPIPFSGRYRISTGKDETKTDLTSSGAHLAPSPYTTWLLTVFDVNNVSLDRSKITDIRIGMLGSYS